MTLERNIDARDKRLDDNEAVALSLTWMMEYELSKKKSRDMQYVDEELCKALALVLKEYVDPRDKDEVDSLLHEILGD